MEISSSCMRASCWVSRVALMGGSLAQTLKPTPALDDLGPRGGGGLGSQVPQHTYLKMILSSH